MTSTINEVGNRYGCLLVIERAKMNGAYWVCKCDCGRTVVVRGGELRHGNRTRCGGKCKNKFGKYWDVRNEVGNRYGKLVVIKRDMDGQFKNGKYKQIRWWCQCDCGVVKSIRGTALRKGDTKSCGCLRTLPSGEAAFKKVMNSIKQGARVRGYEFSLTEDDVKRICTQRCFYCGVKPSQEARTPSGNFFHNGIDRIDNTKGYTVENSVSCCTRCNRAKHKMSIREFKEMIVNVYNHWASLV